VIALTIFAVLNVIYSQNNLGSSFTCSSVIPTKNSDCTTAKTNTGNLCCYLSGLQSYSTEQMCLSIPSVSYTGAKTYVLNGKTYMIDCGVQITASATILNSCGPSPAVGKEDCQTGSSFSNSCCWADKQQGCYWLGTKYRGETNWAGMKLDCASSYLTFSMTFVLFFLAFVF
jgi:hypothetical protein